MQKASLSSLSCFWQFRLSALGLSEISIEWPFANRFVGPSILCPVKPNYKAALMNLKDKVSVVTGGSSGIGRTIASLLASNGARVIICARTIEDLRNTSEIIKTDGGDCSYIKADISDEKEVNRLARKVLDRYGQVDILVNNAGVGLYKPLADSTSDDWDKIINTNLRGPFLCSKAFSRIMIQQKSGCIINIASKAGKEGIKNLSIYCASKFGVIGLTEAMKKELADFGIEVFCICPSYVRSDFFRNFPADFSLPLSTVEPEAVAKQVLAIITHRSKLRRYLIHVANNHTVRQIATRLTRAFKPHSSEVSW